MLKNAWKDLKKKDYCLKMYIHKKHHFFWYEKNTVRAASNQPSVPSLINQLANEIFIK